MFVVVRFLFVFVGRMLIPVLLMLLSVRMLMSMGVLVGMTVLEVPVVVFMVVLVSVFVFHNPSAQSVSLPFPPPTAAWDARQRGEQSIAGHARGHFRSAPDQHESAQRAVRNSTPPCSRRIRSDS
jgi:hypothetical protein